MEKLVFQKEASDGLKLAVTAIREKSHLRAMEDLDTSVICFDNVVKESSKGKFGIALVPSEKQTHPQLTEHRFYVLCVVDNPERKKVIAKLDLIAAPVNGVYPIFIFGEDGRPYPIMEKIGVETRFLQHCCAGPLPALVAAV